MRYLYRALPQLTCFDGEGTPPAGNPPAGETKTFTQEEFNKALAKDKAIHQAQLEKVTTDYKKLLESQNLSAAERKSLEESLATMQGELKTKDETIQSVRKDLEDKYTKELSKVQTEKSNWETRYRQETIERSIIDAAVEGEAYRPSQIVNELGRRAKLVDIVDSKTGKLTGKFKTVIELPDIDPVTKEDIVKTMTPKEAIEYMKGRSEEYGNMFKSNVVPGIGAQSGANHVDGKITDWSNVTMEQYQKLRKEKPELLGLK